MARGWMKQHPVPRALSRSATHQFYDGKQVQANSKECASLSRFEVELRILSCTSTDTDLICRSKRYQDGAAID